MHRRRIDVINSFIHLTNNHFSNIIYSEIEFVLV